MPPMRPMIQSKEKTDVKALKKIVVYCKRYLPTIFIALCFAVVGAITTIIGPERIEELTDTILNGLKSSTGIDMSVFVRICIGLLTLYLIGAIANYTQQFIMATITQNISKSLRTDINRKINLLPLQYFDTTTRGDILSRVTNDVDTISQTLGSSIANLVSSMVLFVGVVYKMFVTNPVLALVTIASSLVGFVIMFMILGKSQKFFNQRQKNLGDMNGHIEEIYTNHHVMKAYNAEEDAKQKFQSINQQLYQNNWKSQFLSGFMQPIMGFIGNLSYALIFIVGVALILKGSDTVTFGTIMSFTIYARLFSNPLTTFAQSMTSIQQASAASKRVFEMLESEELANENHKVAILNQVEGNVTFNHVQFGYTKDHMIIHDFSAHLKKGQKVAIVGPTGAGKTTIVNLLMRFYELNAGSIEIDGVSITDMKREVVHDLFDMILQDTWLFKGTIRENLVYNKEQVSDERLDEVCEAVGLKHFIHTLPQKYDTILDDTISLSEGQKQQLTIARAMIKDAPLLILDEATSSVDTRTEQVIQSAMDHLTKGRTSFVIAHRLSTIKNADVILVMKNGDIIEQGTHQSLLEYGGFYATLYNSQFEPVS